LRKQRQSPSLTKFATHLEDNDHSLFPGIENVDEEKGQSSEFNYPLKILFIFTSSTFQLLRDKEPSELIDLMRLFDYTLIDKLTAFLYSFAAVERKYT